MRLAMAGRHVADMWFHVGLRMALRRWPVAVSVPWPVAMLSSRRFSEAEAQAVLMLCERRSIVVVLGRARGGLAVRRRRRGGWMYDAGVSVQQSVRASSQSRAYVCVDVCVGVIMIYSTSDEKGVVIVD